MRNRMHHAQRWFMVGTMAGALGMGIGVGLKSSNAGRQLKRVRRNAANMAARVSRDAGTFINQMGDQLANKIR